jgi:MFS family permease
VHILSNYVLIGAPFASYSLGILLVYTMGSMLPWRVVAGLCAILPLCALLALYKLPESPPWLAKVGKHEEALRALTWLRGGQMAQARSELAVLAARREHEEKVRIYTTSIIKTYNIKKSC